MMFHENRAINDKAPGGLHSAEHNRKSCLEENAAEVDFIEIVGEDTTNRNPHQNVLDHSSNNHSLVLFPQCQKPMKIQGLVSESGTGISLLHCHGLQYMQNDAILGHSNMIVSPLFPHERQRWFKLVFDLFFPFTFLEQSSKILYIWRTREGLHQFRGGIIQL